MCIVLLPIGVCPTAVNICMHTSIYRFCVNVYCVTATTCQPNWSYQMYQHIKTEFVCEYVLCSCRRMSTQLKLTKFISISTYSLSLFLCCVTATWFQPKYI